LLVNSEPVDRIFLASVFVLIVTPGLTRGLSLTSAFLKIQANRCVFVLQFAPNFSVRVREGTDAESPNQVQDKPGMTGRKVSLFLRMTHSVGIGCRTV
jgi:hypothetical protein